jgi:hypothetical protein
MKTLLIGILAGTLVSALSFAQDTGAPPAGETVRQAQQSPQAPPDSPSSASTGTSPRIAPGSVIPVQLTKTIDAKKVKTGDLVEAKVTQDLKAGSGEVIVPKDTKMLGHVTEAQARSKEQKESQVGIAFDHAVMKNGNDMPLPMSIQAIIAPAAVNGGNSDTQAPSAPGGGGMAAPNNGGRPGMGTGTMPQSANPPTAGGQTNTPAGNNPPITANTKGVVGLSNLELSSAATADGSIISSEKSNVKLDGGTLMLLRVNQ